MLSETTNFFETPQKKLDKELSCSKRSSKLKDRKDKRKKMVLNDIGDVRKAIDFNKFDDQMEVLKVRFGTKEPQFDAELKSSNNTITKLR